MEGDKKMQAVAKEAPYIWLDEAIKDTGRSRATVYRWMDRLDIKPRKFVGARRIYISRAEYQRIMEVIEQPWLAGEVEQ